MRPRKTPTDLTGRTFGEWKVLKFGRKGHPETWLCRCSCGTERRVSVYSLLRGISTTCGCGQRKASAKAQYKHGCCQPKTPEYTAFIRAKMRCYNPKNPDYKNYGARGIRVLFSDFPEFLSHIGQKPSRSHSLDRIDVDGNYAIGNVRWATALQQSRNRRICIAKKHG